MPRTKFFFPLLLVCSLVSCAARKTDSSPSLYIEGLKALGKNNGEQAVRFFRESLKTDDSLCALLSKEELLPLLYEQLSYGEIIGLTEPQTAAGKNTEDDFIAAIENKNLLRRWRIASLIRSGSPRAEEELLQWLVSEPFGAEHARFSADENLAPFFSDMPDRLQNLIAFKSALYAKNYARALGVLKDRAQSRERADSSKNAVSFFFDFCGRSENAVSEVCAAVLYGSRNAAERADYAAQMKDAARLFDEGETRALYCLLCAARLYARSGESYRARAFEQFEQLLQTVTDAQLFDRILWNYADAALKNSARTAIGVLQRYAPQWRDPSFFDDTLELLSYDLLAARNWKGYYEVYRNLSQYMSADACSKYAFVAGRLAETGLLASTIPDADYKSAYAISYKNTEGSLYYRLLAAERLNIPFADIERSLLHRKKKQSVRPNAQAERLLKECAQSGCEDKLYALFFRFKDYIGAETSAQLNAALIEKKLYPQALRTAVWAFGQSDVPIKNAQLQMLYPRFYNDAVENLCTHYALPEYLAYALIRSESFFDKDIRSNAGAAGLTQLMESTASDIARKLKIRSYDIADPGTNIEFGIFYLKELISRLNGSNLLALFSYNAGITKVRRWSAAYPELSKDLLLEVLPYTETREYGRKILTAASLYACLYYGKTTHEIVREIMR